MKKFLLIVVFVFGFFSFGVSQVFADNDSLPHYCDISVNGVSLSDSSSNPPTIYATSKQGNTLTYAIRICGDLSLIPAGLVPVINYNTNDYGFWNGSHSTVTLSSDGQCLVGNLSANFDANNTHLNGVFDVEIEQGKNEGNLPVCQRVFAHIAPSEQSAVGDWGAAMNMCSSVTIDPTQPINGDDITVKFTVPEAFWPNLINSPEGRSYSNLAYKLIRSGDNNELDSQDIHFSGGLLDPVIYRTVNNVQAGNYTAKFFLKSSNSYGNLDVCSKSFNVGSPNEPGGIIEDGDVADFKVCDQTGAAGSDERAKCQQCFNAEGIWTGIGCIPFKDTAGLVKAFIIIGLGIAGTVVILMVLAGAFLMSTSRGEPQRVDEAKSLITSAVIGIFFLIFSVSILQFIGVRILQIPGFG